MASWPGTLPQYMNAESYSEQPEDGRIRTEMDAGPDFIRRRYSATTTPFSGALNLTKTQVSTLETFYETTLNGGVDAFDWVHPRTGASVEMRFLGRPQYQAYYDDFWQVSLNLEILP